MLETFKNTRDYVGVFRSSLTGYVLFVQGLKQCLHNSRHMKLDRRFVGHSAIFSSPEPFSLGNYSLKIRLWIRRLMEVFYWLLRELLFPRS